MMARTSVSTPAQALAADKQAARLHKGRHGKDKKDIDPFLGLPNDAVTLPPSSNGRENMTAGQSRSFLADVCRLSRLIACRLPILMTVC